MKLRTQLMTFLLSATLLATAVHATEFYVSPNGSANGNGSVNSPWDISTALAHPPAVRPGDIIWLRGGTYTGNFTSSLNGSAAAPIIVRQYPGERAILDGASDSANPGFTVAGSWAWYWGFEVTNSDPTRRLPVGSFRNSGFVINGPNTKFINLIVHDTGQGFAFWTPAQSSELYGNLIYYNGFVTSGSHGHGIYTQNNTGIKTIAENIIFDQFGFGLHAYTQGGSINNFNIDGNISFNNGMLGGGYTNNILVGGYSVAQNNNITNNYTYYTPAVGTGYNNIGYDAGCANTTINNNYFVSGYFAISLPNCIPTQMAGNTFYGITPGWIYGAYPNNVMTGTRPSGVKVFVRPNKYEPGRGNIAIFNWALQSTVSVDLSPLGLSMGSPFEIRDAENFLGAPVLTGVYTGTLVSIPMAGLVKVRPSGYVDIIPPHTGPEFGAFVVLPTGGGGGSSVFVNVVPGAAALTAAETQQFTATVTGNSNTAVSWSISPQVGSISSTGLYTAPSPIASTQTVTVKAISVADSARFGSANITLQPPPTGTAQFTITDTSTQGSWKSAYGSEGFNVIGDMASYPAYAAVTTSGQSTWTWLSSTTDIRGLLKQGGTDRIAATWYGSTYSIDINITDGKSHKLAIYCMDWDKGSRIQTVDVVDAGTGIVLDTRSMSNFVNGQYLVWNVSGHVTLRVTRNTGANAVLSGIFFGPADGGTTPPVIPPIVPPITPPIIPPTGGSGVQFVTSDTARQGNWKTVYGGDGYNVIGDSSLYPSYASVVPSGNLYWAWDSSSSESRAVQKSSSLYGRVAAAWYTPTSFNIDINVTDGKTHQFAVYAVDWDNRGRIETVDILDPQNGAKLDSRTLSNFNAGKYLVWNISGHVIVRVTNVSGINAVVSGLFFGTAGTTSAGAQFLRTDNTTAGNWKNVYGESGYGLPGDILSYPAFAALNSSAAWQWVWASSTADARGLQKGSNASDRIAGAWYGAGPFNLDLTISDAVTHEVAIYCVDWDARGRVETIEILDAQTLVVLDTRTLTNFTGGQYLVWKVSGHVLIRASASAGPNSVISGIFF